jgi:TolB protein
MAANTWKRLTVSRDVNEGQPAWGPGGREIVYVSDETRRLHLYIIDVATKAKRRITSSGSQNVDPDWGSDGRITYTTKRGGNSYIAVMNPSEGDKSARLVTEPGRWEHPSWAPDRRHVVAECDGILYLVDTDENADKPVRLFSIPGKCITPTWSR